MPTLRAPGPYSEACRDAFDLIDLSLETNQKILDAPFSTFVPLGEIALGSDDMLVHAGIKTRSFDSVKRVAEELFVGDRLLRRKPERVDALPMFTLPTATSSGMDTGILTEDFTLNGARKLDELYQRFHPIRLDREDVPEGLYRDVYDALDGKVYSEAFGHMMGWVGHLEVMVDFNDIAFPKQDQLEEYKDFARSITIDVGS